MQIGVLGSGITGQTIGSKLIQLGHEVMLGSRSEANPAAVAWARDMGAQHALYGTFMNAAAFGEIIFNCTLNLFAQRVCIADRQGPHVCGTVEGI